MFSALKDQLIKAGLAPVVETKPEPKPAARAGARPDAGPSRSRPGQRPSAPERKSGPRSDSATRPARGSGEPDLKAAFAARERAETAEKLAQQRAAEEESRRRKAQRAELKRVLALHTPLNDAAAEIARNFLWGRKIRRVYVTADQLKAVNGGTLGIVALDGRFLLHPADVVREVGAIDVHAVGLLVDPNAPEPEPDYDDPRYQVPDDLIW